jgi:hypothetical protein
MGFEIEASHHDDAEILNAAFLSSFVKGGVS